MQLPIVVVLAAGKGTRMKSETAKVLHEVAGRPLVVWAIENARESGCERAVVVVGHQRKEVEGVVVGRFGDAAIPVVQEEQRGTGDALRVAVEALGSESPERTLLVVSGDVPLVEPGTLSKLCQACSAETPLALLATRAPFPVPYGRVVRDGQGKVARIVEDGDASEDERRIDELNAGFYAMSLGFARSELSSLGSDNQQGEFYLPDLVERAAKLGGAAAVEASWEEVAGINDRRDLARVEKRARLRINDALMASGVTLCDPGSTYVDADVTVQEDVWLGPNVSLRGRSKISKGVRIDVGAVLLDSEVEADAWIKPYCMLHETSVGVAAHVGPFAHCRPGTVLAEEARVGNFVETKKAHIQKGAKANHLAYLGDVSVGQGANIGAGTITCNYDGFTKHKTVIEAGAFIGSDSQLVAPVTVGRDAYVGSGTTVTKDVPRAALALSRIKQVNKDGWADRFREVQKKRKGLK